MIGIQASADPPHEYIRPFEKICVSQRCSYQFDGLSCTSVFQSDRAARSDFISPY